MIINLVEVLTSKKMINLLLYKNQNRLELADIEIKQSKIIERFLPVQMNFEDLEKLIVEIINQTGAQGMKDMGKVMGIASVKLSGKADGKTISNIVRSKLV